MNPTLLMSVDSGRPQAESYGIRLWSALFIAVLFLSISLLSSPIPGVNEPHYLAKARAFDDPAWCSRDFFLTSGNAHDVFFRLTGFLTRRLPLETVALIGRTVSCLLLGFGWSMLGHAVGLAAVSRILAAGLFAAIALAGSFSGEWLLGGFESKVPAWGLALMAVSLWVHGDRQSCPGWMTLAGVVCGLACSLHPVVGGWIAACMCLASLVSLAFRFRGSATTRTAKPVIGLAALAAATILFSLPGLIPALRLVTDTTIPLKDRQLASFIQVFWRLRHHLDPTEFSAAQWQFALICGASLLWGARGLRKRGPNPRALNLDSSQLSQSGDPLNQLLVLFMISTLIAASGVIIGWHTVAAREMSGWEWRASLLKFYPFRCFDGLLPMTTALVFGRLVQQRLDQQRLGRTVKALRSPRILSITFLLLLLPLIQAWRVREAVPAGYTSEQFADWQEACRWIRRNTDADALFLTPRESFAFKWFAERAEFVCYKDCPQDAAGILTWNDRLWLLHDWTLSSSSDLRYDNADLLVLREKTNCDYVLTRILGPFESEPVWQGRLWRIYEIPSLD